MTNDAVPHRIRVVKVGGSLFDLPDLGSVLRRWLTAQPPAANVIIAGGGTLADTVRQWDQRHGIGEEESHWLCVDLLHVSAGLLASLLADVALTADIDQLRATLERSPIPSATIFCPSGFLRKGEPKMDDHPLPHTWRVTSDSIAARLAELIGANELTLLKSADASNEQCANSPLVDDYFHTASRAVPRVRLVNLRRWAQA